MEPWEVKTLVKPRRLRARVTQLVWRAKTELVAYGTELEMGTQKTMVELERPMTTVEPDPSGAKGLEG